MENNIKFCCLCGKHHKEGECKAFNEENEKFVINRVNNMENEIIKRFREKFSGDCFVNFGIESDCGGDIEKFILSELKALKEECLDGKELPDEAMGESFYIYKKQVAKAFEKRGV